MPIRHEIILPKRVVPQPTPSIYPNGDCGACVLGGLLSMTVPEVYKHFEVDIPKEHISYEVMRRALYDKKFDRKVIHHPEWPESIQSMRTYGNPSWGQAMEWYEYLRMGLDAGYYVIANVDYSKQGEAPDHWVLIVGAHEIYPEEQGAIREQVLVSCSARSSPDEEWVDIRDFLRQRGGFNVFLARPRA